MIAFGHTAVGSAIGLISYHYLGNQNPALGLAMTGACGIVSHYIADSIPHGHFFKSKDYKNKVSYAIIFDLLLSLILFLGLAYSQNGLDLRFLYILFGIGSSQLPDIIEGLTLTGFFPKKGFFKTQIDFHNAVHWHGIGNKTLLWSIYDIWQVAVVLICLHMIFVYL